MKMTVSNETNLSFSLSLKGAKYCVDPKIGVKIERFFKKPRS